MRIEASWKELLAEDFEKPSFIELSRHVRERYAVNKDRIFPKGSEIFRAFDLCPFDQVRVVILG